jgi:hypothetical protein
MTDIQKALNKQLLDGTLKVRPLMIQLLDGTLKVRPLMIQLHSLFFLLYIHDFVLRTIAPCEFSNSNLMHIR